MPVVTSALLLCYATFHFAFDFLYMRLDSLMLALQVIASRACFADAGWLHATYRLSCFEARLALEAAGALPQLYMRAFRWLGFAISAFRVYLPRCRIIFFITASF